MEATEKYTGTDHSSAGVFLGEVQELPFSDNKKINK